MSPEGPVSRFLSCGRIAFVGLSRDPKHFSRAVFREWRAAGAELVPVHPQATEIEGLRCHARVADIAPPVEAAFLITPPNLTRQIVEECAAAGVRRVWMHRGGGPGSVDAEAVAYCREHGLEVVPGACPFMFLPHAGLIHRAHGFVLDLFGRKPA